MALLEFDPATDFKLLLLVPLIPLVGYVVQIFFGRHLPRKGDWLLTSGMFVVMAITVLLGAKAIATAYRGEEFFHHSSEAGLVHPFLYLTGKPPGWPLNPTIGILYDGLGAAMLAVVGIVAFFVHLFSVGYMHGDRRYHIFFANISLFSFAMLGLVLSDNLLVFFMFWELMGLMSYLLIGHFSHDPTSPRIVHAARACKKAFLTTRVGDTCLFVGMMMFYFHFHTLSFTELWRLSADAVAANGGEYPAWMTAAGLLIFGGTMGKSAQFPLHIWLPDAMEGPTPVSAMIHAATMVAAGVFLLGRTYPMMSPDVLAIVAVVGSFTALFAATIGTTVFDIKGVLAYSTISQLGFMVAAVGLGGVVPGMFHMVTHAFFKACLFLCAGSVIHGCHHEQDMRKMGGLRKYMPITFACMLASTIAIAGIPLFSGFYSKDKIIMAAFEQNLAHFSGVSAFASIALPLAALLTAFYMFRLIFMTFFGEYRGHAEPHGEVAFAGHPSPGGHGGHAAHGVHATHATPGGHATLGAAHAPHAAHTVHDEHARGHHAPHSHEALHVHEAVQEHRPAHEQGAGAAAGKVHAAATVHSKAPAEAHHAAHGDPHGHSHSPHESPWPITVSLVCLATLGVFGGHFWPATPGDVLANHTTPWFMKLVDVESMYRGAVAVVAPDPHVEHTAHTMAVVVSLGVAIAGIFLAYLLYFAKKVDPGRIVANLGEFYTAVAKKYYIDEFVDATVVRGTLALSTMMKWIDERVVDGIVNGTGWLNKQLGFLHAWFDRTVVDGAVNGVALVTQAFGSVVRLFQTGRIQQYVSFAVAGGLLAAAWLILS